MKIATTVSRFILGLGFVVFGANLLHPFLPQPPIPAGSLPAQFMAVMWPTHWMTLVGIFEFLGGAFLLFGGTAPIGLSLLGPVLVNILTFHILLMGGAGIAPGAVFSVLELFLLYSYRGYFAPIFTLSAAPTSE
ncbi:MAG: DoxX family protein [Elusimicrobia bacterium]|nr:DoxX family protein [Elusimicrobiota bacterium]MDE2237941.1 DoxX family protein [Elusimicrobiota bacterium]MDE2426390.1 DoxX family protein [Elusimicrobiota bacterium]